MIDTEKQIAARTGDASGAKQGVDPFHVRAFRAYSQLAGVRSLLTALERAVWSVHQDISDEGGSLSGEQQLIEIIDKGIADAMALLLRSGETAPELPPPESVRGIFNREGKSDEAEASGGTI